MVLWVFLGLALVAAGGVVARRMLSPIHRAGLPQLSQAESPAVRQAKDVLRARYAKGEISREDYLQGKVEIED
jgi:uncharacterized membrane protein